jgi:hypothetical protein
MVGPGASIEDQVPGPFQAMSQFELSIEQNAFSASV